MTTYYDVLNVKPTATDADIKSAYRELAKQVHPDANPQMTDYARHTVEEKFKEVQEAYTILRDTSKRARYDGEIAKMYPQAVPPPAPTPKPTPTPSWQQWQQPQWTATPPQYCTKCGRPVHSGNCTGVKACGCGPTQYCKQCSVTATTIQSPPAPINPFLKWCGYAICAFLLWAVRYGIMNPNPAPSVTLPPPQATSIPKTGNEACYNDATGKRVPDNQYTQFGPIVACAAGQTLIDMDKLCSIHGAVIIGSGGKRDYECDRTQTKPQITKPTPQDVCAKAMDDAIDAGLFVGGERVDFWQWTKTHEKDFVALLDKDQKVYPRSSCVEEGTRVAQRWLAVGRYAAMGMPPTLGGYYCSTDGDAVPTGEIDSETDKSNHFPSADCEKLVKKENSPASQLGQSPGGGR